jgi:putative endonuclease
VTGAARTWAVYVLRCGDGTLYTGATCDLTRRLGQHRAGRGARYTRARLPVALLWSERARDRGAALRREAAVKRLTRAEKLRLVGAPPARPRRPRAARGIRGAASTAGRRAVG